jgi:hypothetical protein
MTDDGTEQPPRELRIRFSKSQFARTIYADGAWGSVTGQGNIHMALYSEHLSLPEENILFLDSDGRGREQSESTAKGLQREIEVEIIMSPRIAKAIRKWLDTKIQEAEKTQEALSNLDQEGS